MELKHGNGILIPGIFLIGLVVFSQFSIIHSQDANAEAPVEEPNEEESQEDDGNMTEVNSAINSGTMRSFAAVTRDALTKAWDIYIKPERGDAPVGSILRGIEFTNGEERLTALRILELMDSDMNGKISKAEFAALYGPAISTPDQAIELMHKTYDYNLDGVLSIYETLETALTLEGININLQDTWRSSLSYIKERDVGRKDEAIDLHEYILSVVLEMAYGLLVGEMQPITK